MESATRMFSRVTAKPYRSHHINHSEPPFLNDNGHVDFAPGDIENPKNWSTARRAWVSICAVLLVTNATFASSSPSGCFQSISEHFDISLEVAGLTITLFLLGYCAGPLIFAPLSEFYGRRWIFYITFLMYIAFTFLCAFAPNYGSLLVGRFLAGTFVSAPLSNAPGVLADLWGPVERGNAMALFSCMVWAGPALGPVISGFMQLKKDWRWSFYVLLWLGGVTAALMFTIPETFAPIVLKNKAERIRRARIPGYEEVKAPIEATDRSLVGVFRVAVTRPWIILFDTIALLCAVYMSVVYLLLYMLFTIYPIVFQEMRGWNSGVGELPLLGTVVGAFIGAGIVLVDSHMQNKKLRTGYTMKPEDRLPMAMAGGVGFAVCMFWLAWTANFNSIHWIVPCLAGTFLATSMMLIFVSYLNYLVDAYLMFAASAIAANTIARSAFGAAAPLFTSQMFSAMGVGGGGSLIGGVATLLAVIPFAFYRYGEQIRVRSKFAPTQPPKPQGQQGQQQQEQEKPDDEERQAAAAARGEAGEFSETAEEEIEEEKEEEKKRRGQGTGGRHRRTGREDGRRHSGSSSSTVAEEYGGGSVAHAHLGAQGRVKDEEAEAEGRAGDGDDAGRRKEQAA